MTVASRHGFTLFELLVALTLMALLTSVAVPMVAGRTTSAELRSTARSVADGLNRARGRAIATNRPVAFAVDLDERWFQAVEDEPPSHIPRALAVSVTTARSETNSAGQARFRFFPDGSATGGRITLANDRGQQTVMIDWLTGRIQIAE